MYNPETGTTTKDDKPCRFMQDTDEPGNPDSICQECGWTRKEHPPARLEPYRDPPTLTDNQQTQLNQLYAYVMQFRDKTNDKPTRDFCTNILAFCIGIERDP